MTMALMHFRILVIYTIFMNMCVLCVCVCVCVCVFVCARCVYCLVRLHVNTHKLAQPPHSSCIVSNGDCPAPSARLLLNAGMYSVAYPIHLP